MAIFGKKKSKNRTVYTVRNDEPDIRIKDTDSDAIKERKRRYLDWREDAKKRGEAIRAAEEERIRKSHKSESSDDDISDSMDIPKNARSVMADDFDSPRRSFDGNGVTVNVNLGNSETGNGRTRVKDEEYAPPIIEDSEDVPKRSPSTPTTKKGLKREIESEKARRAAIIKAQKRTSKLENKLNEEREKTEGVRTGDYEPTFCDKHPKVCKTAKNIKTATVVATAPVWLPVKAAEKTIDGTKKVAGAVSKRSKSKTKDDTTTSKSHRSSSASVSAQKKKIAKSKTTRSRSTATKATSSRTATKKRTATKAGGTKMARNTSKTPSKAKTPRKATKSTPRRRKSSKGENDGSWWGQGDAGL